MRPTNRGYILVGLCTLLSSPILVLCNPVPFIQLPPIDPFNPFETLSSVLRDFPYSNRAASQSGFAPRQSTTPFFPSQIFENYLPSIAPQQRLGGYVPSTPTGQPSLYIPSGTFSSNQYPDQYPMHTKLYNSNANIQTPTLPNQQPISDTTTYQPASVQPASVLPRNIASVPTSIAKSVTDIVNQPIDDIQKATPDPELLQKLREPVSKVVNKGVVQSAVLPGVPTEMLDIILGISNALPPGMSMQDRSDIATPIARAILDAVNRVRFANMGGAKDLQGDQITGNNVVPVDSTAAAVTPTSTSGLLPQDIRTEINSALNKLPTNIDSSTKENLRIEIERIAEKAMQQSVAKF